MIGEMAGSNKERRLLWLMTFLGFGFAILFNAVVTDHQEFALLARSFIHGKLYFIDQTHPLWWDTIPYNGHHYWPLGPMPAIVMVPFVWVGSLFGVMVSQRYVNITLGMVTFTMIIKYAKTKNFSDIEGWYWALAYCFGSMYIGQYFIPFSWYFAHVVASFLLWGLIVEVETKSRRWMITVLLAAIWLTRVPAGLGATVYVIGRSWMRVRSRKRELMIASAAGFLGVIVAGLGLAGYNWLRFRKPMDMGYGMQLTYEEPLAKAKSYGLFHPIHIAGNVYYSLLSMPLPVYRDTVSHVLKFPFIQSNPWGMSVFITSIYLVYLIKVGRVDTMTLLLGLAMLVGVGLIYSYYGIGYLQYGSRYFLDVFPWLFLILVDSTHKTVKRIPSGLKLLIIVSVVFNLYLLITGEFAGVLYRLFN